MTDCSGTGLARGEGDGAHVPATPAAAVRSGHEAQPATGRGSRSAGSDRRPVNFIRFTHLVVLFRIQESAHVVAQIQLQRSDRHRLGRDQQQQRRDPLLTLLMHHILNFKLCNSSHWTGPWASRKGADAYQRLNSIKVSHFKNWILINSKLFNLSKMKSQWILHQSTQLDAINLFALLFKFRTQLVIISNLSHGRYFTQFNSTKSIFLHEFIVVLL